jgi:hypothetical protein
MIRLMRQGVVDALSERKRPGHSVVVWDRGSSQVVHIKPEDMIIPEEESLPLPSDH